MDFTIIQLFVFFVVCFLVVSLYKEIFNPAFTFFICAILLLLGGVLTPVDVLKGLSNQQIIVIFLLMLVTSGIRSIYGSELFNRLFNQQLKPKVFLFRMMISVSAISAFLNNTPVVAFMIPYVRDWADKTGNSSSKFLIPLSFATILGGMVTVIGTSTNLVLIGLMAEYNQPPLVFTDFLFLGLIVCFIGLGYLFFIGYRLLPSNAGKIESVRENLKEYIVETEIFNGSPLIGRSVKDGGLRNLQDLFLVEIIRDEKVISPVAPEMILEEGDNLFFSGNTQAIYNLIKEDNGLRIPKQDKLEVEGQFNFVEAVIPANSQLIGQRIKGSDFRKKYNASIVAIHRNGKRVSGRVGEMVLSGGDFLLLLANGDVDLGNHEKNLFFVSVPKKLDHKKPRWMKWAGLVCFVLLILSIVGLLPLFTMCVVIIIGMMLMKVLNPREIRHQLDLNLLTVLVCSLAVGVALEKSGTANLIASGLIAAGQSMGAVAVLTALFLVTIFLTALVTNPAAVSIMFPIAMSLSDQLHLSATPFFIAIAFAASGDFMTPIGYQTNLMVYGPGGYTFKDFLRVGTPFTVLYTVICITFISVYYKLI